MKEFPVVPPPLLSALAEKFPDKLPRDASLPPSEVGRLIGQQQVLDFLRRQMERQHSSEG